MLFRALFYSFILIASSNLFAEEKKGVLVIFSTAVSLQAEADMLSLMRARIKEVAGEESDVIGLDVWHQERPEFSNPAKGAVTIDEIIFIRYSQVGPLRLNEMNFEGFKFGESVNVVEFDFQLYSDKQKIVENPKQDALQLSTDEKNWKEKIKSDVTFERHQLRYTQADYYRYQLAGKRAKYLILPLLLTGSALVYSTLETFQRFGEVAGVIASAIAAVVFGAQTLWLYLVDKGRMWKEIPEAERAKMTANGIYVKEHVHIAKNKQTQKVERKKQDASALIEQVEKMPACTVSALSYFFNTGYSWNPSHD